MELNVLSWLLAIQMILNGLGFLSRWQIFDSLFSSASPGFHYVHVRTLIHGNVGPSDRVVVQSWSLGLHYESPLPCKNALRFKIHAQKTSKERDDASRIEWTDDAVDWGPNSPWRDTSCDCHKSRWSQTQRPCVLLWHAGEWRSLLTQQQMCVTCDVIKVGWDTMLDWSLILKLNDKFIRVLQSTPFSMGT